MFENSEPISDPASGVSLVKHASAKPKAEDEVNYFVGNVFCQGVAVRAVHADVI